MIVLFSIWMFICVLAERNDTGKERLTHIRRLGSYLCVLYCSALQSMKFGITSCKLSKTENILLQGLLPVLKLLKALCEAEPREII